MGDFTDQPKLDMLDGDTFGRMTGDASLRRIPWKLLLVGVALFWALVIAGVVIVWAAR
jgi:predicted ABC-type sugar transport system permease subunit